MVQQSFKKKLEEAAINGMVLSVNEVPDGHAGSILNDVSTELQRRKSEEKFGAMCPDAIEPVENFSCMHLGVNFRKAFFDGIRSLTSGDSTSSQQQHERHQTDTLVHEFCKLLGEHGVPDYGLGVLAFPDF